MSWVLTSILGAFAVTLVMNLLWIGIYKLTSRDKK